jgi:hypothetical protein
MPPLDGCDTMENFLNLLWVLIARRRCSPRRDEHAQLPALACVLALLFPTFPCPTI